MLHQREKSNNKMINNLHKLYVKKEEYHSLFNNSRIPQEIRVKLHGWALVWMWIVLCLLFISLSLSCPFNFYSPHWVVLANSLPM